MRGDRPYPDAQWIEAIREFAHTQGLTVQTVTQVLEDDSRGTELAAALGGKHFGWDGTDPLRHEALLRDRYAETQMVVSDRLHVLILAALSGAIPCEMVTDPKPKVQANFDTIGYMNMSQAVTADADLIGFLERQLSRRAELTQRLMAAKATLRVISTKVSAAVADRRDSRLLT
jgi:exopolysaccharide biosynthesis predicted pyruvyltransferase EpsI